MRSRQKIKVCPRTGDWYLISWGCLTSTIFFIYLFLFFCNELFWLAHHKKKLKLWRLPQNKKILLKDGVPPLLAHIYMWEGEDFWQNVWGKMAGQIQGRAPLFLVSKQNLNLFSWCTRHINNCQKQIKNEQVTAPQSKRDENLKKPLNITKAGSSAP